MELGEVVFVEGGKKRREEKEKAGKRPVKKFVSRKTV